ncbi:MAG: 50S ribosomal protein L25/general stress protein Ctc [Pontibacterium sp.]
MSNFTINAVARTDEGKGASRRLRRANLIPGIIYGGEEGTAPVAISMPTNELVKLTQDQAFFSSIITVKVEDTEARVIIKDLQRHPARPELLHADFQRISDDSRIKIVVPLAFVNFENSAASKAAAKFAVEKNTVEITCLAKDLPESLEVDLSAVESGKVLHLSDIKLPEGVEVVALRRGADHDQGIGYVYAPRGSR